MSQRIEWIDTAKLFTMLLVVIGHCNYYTISTPYGGIDFFSDAEGRSFIYRCLYWLVSFIYTFHMPLFMALSGMCFSLSMKKIISFKSLIKSKAYRLLTPFFAVTICLSIPLKYFSGYWDDSENVLLDMFLGQFLLMGNSHLWFIVSLFWIFLAYYLIEKSNWRGYRLWIVLLFLSWLGWFVEPINNFIGIPAAFKHLFFFALGYNCLPLIESKRVQSKLLPYLCLLGVMFGQFVFGYIYYHSGDEVWISVLRPFTFTIFAILGSFAVCAISKNIGSTSHFTFLKSNTYELYLYSDPFNYVLLFIGWNLWGAMHNSNLLSLIMFSSRFVITLFCAIFLIYMVRYLHLKRIFV